MAFQRTFISGPENCSEADVWGSLESNDLDIIIVKKSHNNLWKKNIKATVIFNNLRGIAGQQRSWSHPLRLALDINQGLPQLIVQLLSCSALLCVKLATFDCLWQNICQPFTWFLLSKMPRKLLMDKFHKAIWYTKPGLSAKWITLPVDKSLGTPDRQCSLFCWHLSPG